MDCLFCKIVNKEILAEPIYEDDKMMALLDIHPRAPGHTMVIPKEHCEGIVNLPKDARAPFVEVIQKVILILKKALNPDAFTIGINEGREAGQVIPHLHIHIIPRYKGDGGGSAHTVVDNPPKETLEEIANKIKKKLENSK